MTKDETLNIRVSTDLRSLAYEAAVSEDKCEAVFWREAAENAALFVLLEPCHRCGEPPTLAQNRISFHVTCEACYDGAPDSETRHEYGSALTKRGAVDDWNAKAGER